MFYAAVMSLRWYSTVVDSRNIQELSRWWAETLGWQIIFESEDEVAIVPAWVSVEELKKTSWDRVSPGLVFVPFPESKETKNRLHIDLAPYITDDRQALIDGLLARGAELANVGQQDDATFTVLRDPEGNEFCVLSVREI